jgi:cytochrome c-type biogenesis protein CcmH
MMFEFWLATAILCAVAVMFLLMPVVMARRIETKAAIEDAEQRRKANVLIFKERLRELNADLRAEVISAQEFEELKNELELNLLQDADQGNPSQNASTSYSLPRHLLLLFLGLSFVLVASAYTFYEQWGFRDQVQAFHDSRFNDAELELARQAAEAGDTRTLLIQLRDKLLLGEGNAEGWGLLARSAMNVQEFDLAIEAYRELIKIEPDNPEVQGALQGLLAQALYFGGKDIQHPETSQALDKALSLVPSEPNALGLLAIASFEKEQWESAIAYWNQILQAHPDHPSKSAINMGISRAQDMLGNTPSSDTASLPEVDKGASPPVEQVASGESVSVSISIPELVLSNADEKAVLYVFAKPANGSPMPLAVRRFPVDRAEYSIKLSDEHAMSPQARLSQFEEVIVSAKVSLSGEVDASGGGFESGQVKTRLSDAKSVNLVVEKLIR